MVAEEQAVPRYPVETFLPLREILLERHKRHLSCGPLELLVSVETDVLELEHHVQLRALTVRVFFGLLQCDAGSLTDCHDVVF